MTPRILAAALALALLPSAAAARGESRVVGFLEPVKRANLDVLVPASDSIQFFPVAVVSTEGWKAAQDLDCRELAEKKPRLDPQARLAVGSALQVYGGGEPRGKFVIERWDMVWRGNCSGFAAAGRATRKGKGGGLRLAAFPPVARSWPSRPGAVSAAVDDAALKGEGVRLAEQAVRDFLEREKTKARKVGPLLLASAEPFALSASTPTAVYAVYEGEVRTEVWRGEKRDRRLKARVHAWLETSREGTLRAAAIVAGTRSEEYAFGERTFLGALDAEGEGEAALFFSVADHETSGFEVYAPQGGSYRLVLTASDYSID